MRPKKPRTTSEGDLFRARLDQIINLKHELVQLAAGSTGIGSRTRCGSVRRTSKLTYRWARKGSRPRAIHDQRTQSTYLFGAVCPELGTGAALVPRCAKRGGCYLYAPKHTVKKPVRRPYSSVSKKGKA